MQTFASEVEAFEAVWNMDSEALVLGVFDQARGSEYEAFHKVAVELRGQFVFGELIRRSVALEKLKRVPQDRDSVVVFRSFDVPAVSEPNGVTVEWITSSALNLVEMVDKRTFNVYVQRGLPLVVMWLDTSDAKAAHVHLSEFRAAALEFRNRLTFVYANGATNRLQAQQFGVPADAALPAVTLLDMREFTHYVHAFDTPLSRDSIGALCLSLIHI